MTMLTPVELAMMKSLWRRQAGCVREVQTDLLPDRKLAYTTVMTVLDRLFRKGVVRRSKESRAHIYEPVFSESELRSEAVAILLEDYFDGSSLALRAFLDRREPLSRPTPIAHTAVSVQNAIESVSRTPMDEALL